MTTLVEFLTARLDEDEMFALNATPWPPSVSGATEFGVSAWHMAHIAQHDPARVLREVEFKRSVVAEHSYIRAAHGIAPRSCMACFTPIDKEFCPELLALAAVFSDHPDYREEWA